MKTWKTVLDVCRSSRSGRFASKGKCGMFKKSKVKRSGKKGQLNLFS